MSLVSGKHCLLLDKFQYICQRPVLMMEIDCEREKEIDTMEKLLNKRIKKSVNLLSRCIIAFEKKILAVEIRIHYELNTLSVYVIY